MSYNIGSKINHLLKFWPRGAVFTASWLSTHGYSHQLLTKYRQSDWIRSLGHGAYYRADDTPTWEGVVYALQEQLGLKIHVGGKTALLLWGLGHHLPLGTPYVQLFGMPGKKPPSWVYKYDRDARIYYRASKLFGLKPELGLDSKSTGPFSITISSPERAILEVLCLVPNHQTAEEAFQLLNGLTALRPSLLQDLLTSCNSVKVKRLFLCLSERINPIWLKELNGKRIRLGKGKRQVIKGGILDSKYLITIPENLTGLHEIQR